MAVDGSLIFDTKIDSKGFAKGLKSLGSIGAKALTGVSAGLVAVLGYATKVGASFEAGMSEVSAISGATGKDLEMLSAKAKEMGAKTKFSATQSAEALKYMAMAGWDTEKMLSGLPGVMDLAAASGEDLGLVSDIVTDSMTAFGISADKAGHFSDILAMASSKSNTNVALLGESFKYVAPLAGALGYSAEDTAVALGLMANAGIKGSQAGTTLKTSIANLAKPTNKMQKAIGELGLSLTDAQGNMKPLAQVMDEMRESMRGLDKDQQAYYASTIFGKEAMAGMLAIINTSEEDYQKLTESINNATGASKQMAETKMDNLAGQIELAKSAVEGIGISIYENFQEPLKEGLKAGLENLQTLSDSLTNGELNDSLKIIGEAFGKIVENLAKFVSDVLPMLIRGFADLIQNADKFGTVLGLAVTAFATFKTFTFLSGIATAFQTAVVQIKLFTLASSGASVAQGVLNGSLTLWETLVALVTGKITLQTVATKALAVAQGLLNAVMNANPFVLIVTLIVAVVGALVTLWNTNEGFRKAVMNGWKAIKKAFKDVLDWLKGGMEKVSSIGKDLIAGVIKGITEKAKELYAKVKEIAGNVTKGFKDIFKIKSPSRVMDEEVGQMLGKGLAQGLSKSDKYIMSAIETTRDRIKKSEEEHNKKMFQLQQSTLIKSNARLQELGIEGINSRYQAYGEEQKAQVSTIGQAIEEIEKQIELNKSERRTKNNKEKLEQNKKILESEKEVLTAEKKHLEEYSKEYEKVFQGFQDEYEKAYDTIINKQNSLTDKLKAFGELVEKTKTENGVEVIKLADVNKQISTIEEYGFILERLKERGADVDVMNKILSMSIEEAVQYGSLLLKQSDSDFVEYMKAMDKKRRIANEIAKKYYQEELDTLKSDYTDKLAEHLGQIPDFAEEIGTEAGEKLGFAFGNKLVPIMEEMAQNAMAKAKEVMTGEHSKISMPKRTRTARQTTWSSTKTESEKQHRSFISKALNKIAENTGNTNKNIEKMPRRQVAMAKMR